MNKIILVLALCSSLISCVNSKPTKEIPIVAAACPSKERPTQEELDGLLKKALNEGDETAYCEFSSSYLLNHRFAELYYYSLLMASKYNSPNAYNDLYSILTHFSDVSSNGVNFHALDFNTKDLSLYYLVKSYELGSEEAISDIKIIFKDTISIPKSSYYLKKMARGK